LMAAHEFSMDVWIFGRMNIRLVQENAVGRCGPRLRD